MPSGNTAKARVSMLGQWRYGILGLKVMFVMFFTELFVAIGVAPLVNIYIYATIEICFHLELLNWVSIASCDHGAHKHRNHLKPRPVLTLGEPWQTLTQKKENHKGALLTLEHCLQ